MKNWSGYLNWNPADVLYPQSEEEVSLIVQNALEQHRKIRMIGSGHSFTPVCKTDDILVSLDKYQGIVSLDKEAKQVTVRAGTKLFRLNELLVGHGLALENMGDVDVQSIAGAISTGTHGTGTSFGNLSTQVRRLAFVNGLGETVRCSEDEQAELFKAAQVSLGAIGVLTEVTLQCVPAYTLELSVDKRSLDEVLESYTELNEANRNFEFYWFPHTSSVMAKRSNLTNRPPDTSSYKDYFKEMVLENYAFKLLCEFSCRFPGMTPRLSNLAANTIDAREKVNQSHKVFSTSRIVRFNEMEYNIPLEAYKEVKRDIVACANKYHQEILFPLENRFVKQDDIYLSPAYQRDSAYIAVHAYHKKSFKKYFEALESIFRVYGGRPHWGKMHNLSAEDFEALYPRFGQFNEIRAAQDPHGLFLSPYLQSLFTESKAKQNSHEELPIL